jgi:2-dehydro-3-deoxyphosphogluconate aldolase/(4S)-4-hydroxy-2-oxoglutarate aldolase
MNAILEELGNTGVIPVIKIDDVDKAVPLAEALIAGGIPCAEVTFRTAEGEEAIRRIAGAFAPDKILTGAGTVLTTEQVDRAVDAGARFIVSPGFNPRVVEHCAKRSVPIVPGCANPSDMEAALEAGLEVVKFFPAEPAGGLAYIKAVSAPYPRLRFIPTGGISAANLGSYLAFEKIHACGGSWMVTPELVSAGNFGAITALCKEAVQKALGFTLAHVGINGQNEGEARKAAALFEAIFGLAVKEGNSSVFAGDIIEVMKTPFRGKNGHIAIGTYNVRRAQAILERRGIAFDAESAKSDGKGGLVSIYLKEEIAGFAVHLVGRK